jgi:predicted NBD/HSP70 family sugar kinase
MTTEASPRVATTTTANLEELRANVTAIAEKITALKKASPVDKDAMIGASVKELLDAKRAFAQHNNGIGLDGTKWEEPLTKKQKKAKEMTAEKDAAAAATSGVWKGAKGEKEKSVLRSFCVLSTVAAQCLLKFRLYSC